MPKTKKRINKYIYEWIVQGKFECGWEDVASGTYRETRANLRDYRQNDPRYSYRLIYRRSKNPEYSAL